MQRLSRRRLIVLGGTAVGGLIAGCVADGTDDDENGDDDENDGSGTESITAVLEEPSFDELFEWIPAEMTERSLSINIVTPPAFDGIETVPDSVQEEEILGTPANELQYVGYIGSDGDSDFELVVVSGAIDTEQAIDWVADSTEAEFSETDSHEPFEDVFGGDTQRLGMVETGAVYGSPTEWFERAAETRTESDSSLERNDESLSVLREHLPAVDVANIRLPGEDEKEKALALGYDLDSVESDATALAVYADEKRAVENKENAVELAERDDISANDVMVEGKLVIVTGTQQTEELFGEPVEEITPVVAFEFNYDDDTQVVEARHTAGDELRAASTYVRGTRLYDAYTGPVHALAESSFGAEDSLAVGEYFDVVVEEPSFELEIVWQSPETGEETKLARFEGPNWNE